MVKLKMIFENLMEEPITRLQDNWVLNKIGWEDYPIDLGDLEGVGCIMKTIYNKSKERKTVETFNEIKRIRFDMEWMEIANRWSSREWRNKLEHRIMRPEEVITKETINMSEKRKREWFKKEIWKWEVSTGSNKMASYQQMLGLPTKKIEQTEESQFLEWEEERGWCYWLDRGNIF